MYRSSGKGRQSVGRKADRRPVCLQHSECQVKAGSRREDGAEGEAMVAWGRGGPWGLWGPWGL